MSDEEISAQFVAISSDLSEDLHELIRTRPLLAHYTSIETLEKIIRTEEIWFSNPMFMNDLQELRVGMTTGSNIVAESTELDEACVSPERAEIFRHAFRHYYQKFDVEHAIDVYVFCLSAHEASDNDGLLSMWRAYGRNGNGAALVFKTDFITEQPSSPMIVLKVEYLSDEKRLKWIRDRLAAICALITKLNLPDDKLYIAAYYFLETVKIFALKFKHKGFAEEQEWRSVYLPDRDPKGILRGQRDYVVGPRGIEPKLRLPIKPLPIDPPEHFTFKKILDRIILGPSVSTPLARGSVERMLQHLNKADFCEKVVASQIPLRSS